MKFHYQNINAQKTVQLQTVGPIDATVRPPGSKSITNRAFICAALAEGKSHLTGVLESVDTTVMSEALGLLGVTCDRDLVAKTASVAGCGGHFPKSSSLIDAQNSGTTIRFLTAAVAISQGDYTLDGVERMRQRPIRDLVDALAQLDINIFCKNDDGCPPVRVNNSELPPLRGGTVRVAGDVSSQYLSALLMALVCAKEDIRIEVIGTLVSRPYIAMTLCVMAAFGATVEVIGDYEAFLIPAESQYRPTDYAIEPDASAASYFLGAAAITGGRVTIDGLSQNALQGDIHFADLLEQMGCKVTWGADSVTVTAGEKLVGIDAEMNAISDTVQTLAAVALFAEGPTTIRNVAHIRYKETDRIGDLATELRKFGATVEEFEDGMKITPSELHGATIDTYDDHRMAMALSLVGLRQEGVVICDPDCTSKTYPDFFEVLGDCWK